MSRGIYRSLMKLQFCFLEIKWEKLSAGLIVNLEPPWLGRVVKIWLSRAWVGLNRKNNSVECDSLREVVHSLYILFTSTLYLWTEDKLGEYMNTKELNSWIRSSVLSYSCILRVYLCFSRFRSSFLSYSCILWVYLCFSRCV